MVYDVTFGEKGWITTYDLLLGVLVGETHVCKEIGITSIFYTEIRSICTNMIIGRYGYDSDKMIKFLKQYPATIG